MVDLFQRARRRLGNAITGNEQPDPLLERTRTLLTQDPTLNDAALAVQLGLSNPREARRYRQQAQDLLASGPLSRSMPVPKDASNSDGDPESGPLVITVESEPEPFADEATRLWRQRRNALMKNMRVGQRLHTRIMNFLIGIWILLAPPLFVLLTVGEVAYVLYQVRPKDSSWVLVSPLTLIVAGALFIDISMMFTTFRLATRREDEANYVTGGQDVPFTLQRDLRGLTILWLLFAAINVVCQVAFLVNFIDQQNYLLIGVVLLRVIGFIASDYAVAFHLTRTEPGYREVLRTEREMMTASTELSKLDGERLRQEAEDNARIKKILLQVRQEAADTAFLIDLRTNLYQSILAQRRQESLPGERSETSGDAP